jgi:hypothetical protein
MLMPEPDDNPTEALLDRRYQLGECLGRGGMADVYRAEDVLLGREVAIKVIRPGVDGVAAPERARGEMSVLAALNHPSLVTLLDARLENSAQEYLVMELVEGPTLSERLRESPLPPHEAARLAGEIAEALHVVHSAGIVHRDIKPSNVLLAPAHIPGRQYRAKLADFGIAYLVDTTRVTSPGQIIGTVAYLAPEQVTGAEPAPPADVYALGLVLLEALTGQPAFPHAAGVASALARLNDTPDIPAWLGPDWTDLLERMTRIEPSERPTALEVAVEAAGLATGSTVVPAAAPPVAVAPSTAPTEVVGANAPATAILDVPPDADAAPVTEAMPVPGRRKPSPRRRGMLVGAAALGVAAVVGVGVWGSGLLAGSPDPGVTEPAITEPSVVPSSTGTTAPAPASTPVTVGGDETSTEDAEAERARLEQEEAQRRADEEAQRQADEAARQAEEEARRQAEEQQAEEPETPPDAPAEEPAETAPPSGSTPAPEVTTPATGG